MWSNHNKSNTLSSWDRWRFLLQSQLAWWFRFWKFLGRILFARCKNQFLDAREELENDEPLQKFWMSFLQMVELLLSTIYSIRYGDWKLLLQCITRILPYTFTFDHINYVRYLSVMLGDKLSLPDDFPDAYKDFIGRKFAAQLTKNSTFLCIETDKVIEMSLKKTQKSLRF